MTARVDADCHISPTKQGPSIEIAELLRRMDQSGIDQALTWLQPPYERGQIAESNDYVAKATRDHPDRILGFGWADPHLGTDRAVQEAIRCLDGHGFPGVKINGAQNEFVIDDSAIVLPVIEEIAKRDAILALHIGGDAPENTHPWRAGNIAKRYPEMRILIIHIGGAAFHDLSRAAIEIAQEHPSMTLIGSAVRPPSILNAINTLGPERVAFGSDTPFEFMHVELAKYRALLEPVLDNAGMDAVLGGTIRKTLGLDVF